MGKKRVDEASFDLGKKHVIVLDEMGVIKKIRNDFKKRASKGCTRGNGLAITMDHCLHFLGQRQFKVIHQLATKSS